MVDVFVCKMTPAVSTYGSPLYPLHGVCSEDTGSYVMLHGTPRACMEQVDSRGTIFCQCSLCKGIRTDNIADCRTDNIADCRKPKRTEFNSLNFPFIMCTLCLYLCWTISFNVLSLPRYLIYSTYGGNTIQPHHAICSHTSISLDHTVQ